MELKYKDKSTEKTCTNIKTAKKKLNEIVATKLLSTINFLESAKNLRDVANMPSFKLHPLVGDRKETYAIDLGRRLGYRLIIKPLDDEGNELKDYSDINKIYDCTNVIIILEVSNHYE